MNAQNVHGVITMIEMIPTKCCDMQDLEIIEMINWDNWIYKCRNCKKKFIRRHHFFYPIDENTVICTAILTDDGKNEFKIVLGLSTKGID